MSTFNPPSFPRRPKQQTLLSNAKYQIQLAYFRYSVNTALYVMSPGEKLAFNTIVLSALSLFAWALWVCAVWWCVPCSALMGCAREVLWDSYTLSDLLGNNIRFTGSFVGVDLFERIISQASNLDVAKGGLQHSMEAVTSWQDFWSAANSSGSLVG
ncbi:uncharacterized protein RCC_09046 [Ramularia collo-cygni]|uniref:Uncharacterized protein n=1 Tax=Ramularia collo-cygni TaxID=112498 RepID=A0A2D3VLE2_9PEZI|nr:uncharacterized protein RCC_09046 [Ramularia collo-cygni]CZT23334.1 uncharacterized protein RCC_09046 [Ramularia collo-cygni]